MQKKLLQQTAKLSAIILGNCLYTLAVQLFIRPGNLLTGGTPGISLAVQRAFGLSASGFMFCFNSLLFLLALFILGKTFALGTLLSTFLSPALLALFERLFSQTILTNDPLLCSIFGGLSVGAGLGLVVRAGASTGGMDIPPFLLYRFWRIPVSVSLYFFDVCILLAQAVFSDAERILYSLLLILCYTVTLNKVMLLGKNRIEVKIISSKSHEICKAILFSLDRGVTLLHAYGGYSNEKSPLILSIVSARELTRLETLAKEIDPQCFMIISQVSQVQGRGFSLEKRYEQLKEISQDLNHPHI